MEMRRRGGGVFISSPRQLSSLNHQRGRRGTAGPLAASHTGAIVSRQSALFERRNEIALNVKNQTWKEQLKEQGETQTRLDPADSGGAVLIPADN